MSETAGGLFVRLPFEKTIQTMMEVKNAFPLLWWYVGRVTRDYAAAGLTARIGAVLGNMPITDGHVAAELSASGEELTSDKIKHWRRRLEALGYIATLRTPCGLRVFVIGSEKFPDGSIEPLPDWALLTVQDAAAKRSAKFADGRISPSDRRTTPSDVRISPIQYKKQKGNRRETEVSQEAGDFFFESPHLKATEKQVERLWKEFSHLQLDYPGMYEQFERASEWIESQPSMKIKNPVGFMRKWLSGAKHGEAKRQEDEGLHFPKLEPPF